MKSICLLAICLFISIFTTAQVLPVNPLDSMNNFNSTFDISKLVASTLPAPKFMHEAPLGKVYAMPPDNMPCLVPNSPVDNWMPAYNLGPLGNAEMPNPIPRQQLPAFPSIQLPVFPSLNNDPLKLHQTPKVIHKNLMLELARKK